MLPWLEIRVKAASAPVNAKRRPMPGSMTPVGSLLIAPSPIQQDHRSRPARRRLRGVALLFAAVAVAALGFGPDLVAAWHRHRGQEALARRDAAAAIDAFEAALRWDRSSGESHFWLARAYRKTGDMERVRAHLRRAWNLRFPADAIEREEWLAMAQSGQMREAHPHLPELLIDPRDDGQEICEAYVNGYFVTCRFHEGLELLNVWRQEYPGDSQPYLFRAQYLAMIGDNTAAAEACREGLQREPGRYELEVLLAAYLVELHEFEEANRLLRRLMDERPDDPAILAAWSQCLVGQGRNAEAEEALARLLRIEPRHVKGRLSAAQLDLDAGRISAGLERIREVVEEHPYDLEARYLLATALQAGGDRDGAAREFARTEEGREALQTARRLWETVVTQEPFNAELRYQIGSALLEYSSPEGGAGWLRSALEIDPHHAGARQTLAAYYRETGQHDLARQLEESSPQTVSPEVPSSVETGPARQEPRVDP